MGTVETLPLMARSHAAQYHAHCPWDELRPDDGLVIVRGDGPVVFDEAGRRYLDAISGGWNVALGFSCEPLIAAATQQLRTLPYYHSLYNRTTPAAIELSERLRAIAPIECGRVVYSNSGSEAVETAVKLAWLYHAANGQPQRRKLLARHGSVHGSTIFTSCLGGLGLKELFGPDDQLIEHVSSPNLAAYGIAGEQDEQFLDRLVAELEDVIAATGADNIAAMVVEPIAVVEGFHVPAPRYLSQLREVLTRHGILLIVDEVVTGFGRTGHMFASEWLHCAPDILVVGKALTSGYAALAATLPSKVVGDAVDRFCASAGEFPHAMTTGMHPVAMRVALAVIDQLEGGVLDNVRSLAPYFAERLHALGASPAVARTASVGLGGSLHLRDPALSDGSDAAFRMARVCRERGVLVHGQHGAIIVAPPLIVSRDDIDVMIEAMSAALDQFA